MHYYLLKKIKINAADNFFSHSINISNDQILILDITGRRRRRRRSRRRRTMLFRHWPDITIVYFSDLRQQKWLKVARTRWRKMSFVCSLNSCATGWRGSVLIFYYYYYWSLLYSAILRFRADSPRSHVILHEWLAFYSAFSNIHRRWHDWCHVKLLPSPRVLCTPYNHAPCHFMQSHVRHVHACLAQ